MSYNDGGLAEEQGFRVSDDEDMDPLEETGDFVFDEETDEDPDDRYH